ncbi:MAG: TlpA disulfide reductase family protein [Nitrospira sp.]|nr:TlpA family protein disulfide reductase [Candidatus Manganitrophaceae bacterium]HIL34940.1 TlpA family protein disulfide reductase [Candidatus Manganitrophaceae bacterium]
MKTRLSLLKTLLVMGVIILVFISITGMASRPPLVGGPAPHFQLKTLKDTLITIADYRGKVVLLNFWATWCKPCMKEMPEMQVAYEEYKDRGFVILGVNFGESPGKAARLVKQMGLTFPILLDQEVEVASRYQVVSLPVSFFIGPNGIIKERVFGGTLTKAGIGEVFHRLMDGKKG